MGEIAKQEDSGALIKMIERVACSPDVDIEKLEKMLDMQERVLNKQSEQQFWADMAIMQSEIPEIDRSKKGHNSKYAPLEDINSKVKPVLSKHGFSISFKNEQSEKGIKVITILAHRMGHKEQMEIALPYENSGNKNAVQAVGSSVSYGRRYGICGILNISTGEDDDGRTERDAELISQTEIIGRSKNMDDLKINYKNAYNKLKGDRPAVAAITKAKDDKKTELMK